MTIDMKDIVSLAKRRGFVFPASDIYGGINGFWDYGPLGVELKNNIRDLWWRSMVVTPPIGPDGQPLEIVGLDSSIIQNPKTWEASGHVGGFNDPMVDCRETKARYRADHLIVYQPKNGEGPGFAMMADTDEDTAGKRIKNLSGGKSIGNYERTDLVSLPSAAYANIIGPDTKTIGTLTEPRQFNLMLDTYPGVVRDEANKAYLRPETAQGIFLNFKNVMDSSRVRMPFGIAQVGKAFRNEVTPRNFIYRSREFEQMEMEWFCHPDDARKWFDFWVAQRKAWWLSIGVKESSLLLRTHDKDELAHYAKTGEGTVDIEFAFPFTAPGFGELEGIAHRSNFDLTQHTKLSGVNLEYMDPVTNERYMPHVIEPAAGLTRAVLAVMCEAYTVDANRPSGMYMNFHPAIAPKKAAILPLTAKDQHPIIATKLYMELREHFAVDLDIKQNIGKRYARQDEIGTPFCFTIDDQTVADQTVTVRDRNTTAQERIHLSAIEGFLRTKMKAARV